MLDNPPFPLDPVLASLIISTYNGERNQNSYYHGQGEAQFKCGHKYVGQFYEGRIHGKGEFSWSDGVVYQGDFLYNQITGKGTYTWPDGSKYEGEVQNGLRHGKGLFICGSIPSNYNGDWYKGMRHGKGVLKYDVNGRVFYDGEWANDQREGFGRMKYPSGNEYKGEWMNDKKHGHGVMEWFDVRESYTGNWSEDYQDGIGEHVWKEGMPSEYSGTQKQMWNRYQGHFVQGQRQGSGVFYYANGAKYDGEWQNNVKHGSGIFYFEDGNVFEGQFEKDKMTNNDMSEQSKKVEECTILKPKIKLYIDDILPTLYQSKKQSKEMSRMKREIDNTVLRINTDLKCIYKYYSVTKHSKCSGRKDGIFTMEMRDLWRFVKECDLIPHGMRIANVNRIFLNMTLQHRKAVQQQKKKIDLNQQSKVDIHDPKKIILFREFIEMIVRLAHEASLSSSYSVRIEESLMKLYTNKIQPFVCVDKDSIAGKFQGNEVQAVFSKHRDALLKIFEGIACTLNQTDEIALEFEDITTDIRSLAKLMADRNILNANFTLSTLLMILEYEDEEVDPENENEFDIEFLDAEITFTEFLEALLMIANENNTLSLPIETILEQFLKTKILN